MPFLIVRNDITAMKVDAIVNAANCSLLGGGGVDGAIHRAAGPELLEECRMLGGCNPGQAKITRGYRLPAPWVIHTVGPIWQGGNQGEEQILRSCYKSALALACSRNLKTIAFPLISAGAYGYPRERAFRIACDTIQAVVRQQEDLTVYLVVFEQAATRLARQRFPELQAYIDDRYAQSHMEPRQERRRRQAEFLGIPHPCCPPKAKQRPPEPQEWTVCSQEAPVEEERRPTGLWGMPEMGLEAYVRQVDESFSQMLLRKITDKGMTDAQCYRKANIDRKLFSKIRSDPAYRPSKPTVLAFAVALELPLEEARQLLAKAGFALSHSSRFDLILEYFLARGIYDVFQINEALFAFDQNLLGA